MKREGPPKQSNDRAQRLAEALRANLRKRKSQGKARKDPVEPGDKDRSADTARQS